MRGARRGPQGMGEASPRRGRRQVGAAAPRQNPGTPEVKIRRMERLLTQKGVAEGTQEKVITSTTSPFPVLSFFLRVAV